MRFLIENNDIKNEDVEKIIIRQPAYFAGNFLAYPPTSSVDTASSLKYIIGVYLHLRKIGVEWYEDYEKFLSNKEFTALADRIEIIKDDNLQALFEEKNIVKGKAEIYTSHGLYEKEMKLEELKGNPRNNPMSTEEIHEKFLELSSPVIGIGKANSFLEFVEESSFSLPISDMMKLLVTS